MQTFSEYQQAAMAHRYQQEVTVQGVRVRTTWFPIVDMASGVSSIGSYAEFAAAGKDWTRFDIARHAGLIQALTMDPIWLRSRCEGLEAMQAWMQGGDWPGAEAGESVQ